jgi:hypothetical protein
MMEPSIAQRGEENAEGKLAIAREAARMVADGSSVLIRFRHYDRGAQRTNWSAGLDSRCSPTR